MSELKKVSDGLLTAIDRWAPEVISAPPRSTLRYGIAQKCYGQIDKMLAICVAETVIACGKEGQTALNACAGGKPLNRLTLGERVQVLERLDSFLAQAVDGLVTRSGRCVMGPKGVKLLHRLSRDRNRFAHDLVNLQPSEVTELLARASELCDSPLIQFVIALQHKRNSGPPPILGGHRP
jgi:hypothetical protein